jgi:hypothetical protein
MEKSNEREEAGPQGHQEGRVEGPGIEELKFMIESAFERRAMLSLDEIDGSTRPTVERVIAGLEKGEFRVAEPTARAAGRSTSG